MSRIVAVGIGLFLSGGAWAADLPAEPAGERAAYGASDVTALGTETFAACQRAIAEWAEPYAPVDIQTVSAGPVKQRLFGRRVAPLYVQIVYDRDGGREKREANVECTVRRNNTVAVRPTR